MSHKMNLMMPLNKFAQLLAVLKRLVYPTKSSRTVSGMNTTM